MTGDTLHWILLVLQILILIGVGVLLFRRYPPPRP